MTSSGEAIVETGYDELVTGKLRSGVVLKRPSVRASADGPWSSAVRSCWRARRVPDAD
jgi:hypothetical protein